MLLTAAVVYFYRYLLPSKKDGDSRIKDRADFLLTPTKESDAILFVIAL